MITRRRKAIVSAALAACLLVAAGSARWWAVSHVTHFTGTTPQSLDCVACHVIARGGSLVDRLEAPRYLSPYDLAVSPDGAALYVTAPDAGALLIVDVDGRRPIASIPVGKRPRCVALSPDGSTAYVTDEEADEVHVVNLSSRSVTRSFPAGYSPAGVAVAGDQVVVANAMGSDVSLIDAASGAERARLAAGHHPFAVAAASADVTGSKGTDRVLVTHLLAAPAGPDQPPATEVMLIDLEGRPRVTRHVLADAHLLEGAAFLPGGTQALVTLVRPRNLLPALQVERGWMMTAGLAVLDFETGELAQLPLDETERFFADPADVAVTPDGRTAFVSHGGADIVTAIDLSQARKVLSDARAAGKDMAALADRLSLSPRFVAARIAMGSNPRGLAMSPDGRLLFVAERLDDTIGVIDVAARRRVGGIDLGGPKHQTALRQGEKVFHSARATLQHQFSCHSCHPENHLDGLVYDFEGDGLGRNLVDNRSLLGVAGTAPFKWNGRNTSLYMQCGIRFARFLTRSEPFRFEEQVALAAFLESLTPPRNRHRAADGSLTEPQQRGREHFLRSKRLDGNPIPLEQRCVTCHPGRRGTDRQLHDVGSAGPWDSEARFDTPHLDNIWRGAPYLHDGRARTLEEIWTVYSPNDEHGVTSDLGKRGLNDLIEYLRTL